MTDPRDTPANGRVAHVSLGGTVEAGRFVEGVPRRVAVPVADLFRHPERGRLERQLLWGEPFLELERREGWSFGRAELSGYVGYLETAALAEPLAVTHRVSVRSTLAFAEPDLKTPGPRRLSLGSSVRVLGESGRFLSTDADWIPAGHLISGVEDDPVAVAERLLGTPYLWGGNSAFGIDCSGLVQIAFRATGRELPGDSDQQARALPAVDGADLRRGDLIAWKGHIAFVADPETLLHANAHAMAVAFEPLGAALRRIEASDGPPVGFFRV